MKRLSVIVPSRNIDNLRACVAAVRKHEPEARIIAVDDGIDISMWAEWAAFGKSPADIVRIGEKPFNFARNVNIGIRAAGDDDVILLNDDALLESPGGFTLMQRAAAEHLEYGIIGAVTNVTGQPLQWFRDIGLREVPHIAFVCVLIPRRTRAALIAFDAPWVTGGLLDERYCLDYGVEDRDYCEQVRAAGLKVGVHDGCYVDHGSLVSTFRGDPKTPKSFQQNLQLFKAKWGLTEVR